LKFIHMIFFNDFKETPLFPVEMYFKHTSRIGVIKTRYIDDMKYLFSKKRFRVKSFLIDQDHMLLEDSNYIIRDVEITTGSVESRTAFFKYDEPLPMSIVYLYDRKKLDVIMKYILIDGLIEEINISLEEGEPVDVLEGFDFDYAFGDVENKGEIEEFIMSVNWFVRTYIDRIYTESFRMNIYDLSEKAPMISYKIYEMKELGDRGILSKL